MTSLPTIGISSLIPLLIFSQRLLHFVVFDISTLDSYNQRFFQSEIDIFLNVRLNPPCLPGYNVAKLPGCSLNIQWMCRLFERGKCQKKSTKGVIFYNQRKSFLFQTKKRGLRCVIIRSVVCLRKEQLCELEWRVSVIAALNFMDPVCPVRDRLSSRTSWSTQFKVSELLIFSVAENFQWNRWFINTANQPCNNTWNRL